MQTNRNNDSVTKVNQQATQVVLHSRLLHKY